MTFLIANPGGGPADELPWARELPADLRKAGVPVVLLSAS